jgi:protein O-mannosyl-transferase
MRIAEIVGERHQRLFILPALLALCCFVNTLNHGFVSDDRQLIINASPILQDWSFHNLSRLFDRDIWAFFYQNADLKGQLHSPYYRPFFAIFMMLNYSYAGINPFWWHFTAILLHICATILAYWLLLVSLRAGGAAEEKDSHWLAAIGATIFAIHPAQTESVAWIAAYVNALSTIFIFGTLISYLRARRTLQKIEPSWLLLGSIMYLLALLTKEIAIITPLIIVAYEILVIDRDRDLSARLRSGLLTITPFLLLTIGYIVLRVAIFGTVRPPLSNPDFPEMKGVSIAVNLLTLPAILFEYAKIVLWPFDLSPIYLVEYVRSPELPRFILPLAAIVAIGAAGSIIACRSLLARIGLIWLIVPLLPMLDIRSFNHEFLVQDRYLYLSLLGAGLLIAGAGRWLNDHWKLISRQTGKDDEKNEGLKLEPLLLILEAVLLIGIISITIQQNNVWVNEESLWSRAHENAPDSCAVNLQLGFLSEDAGRINEALSYYEQMTRSCPNSPRGYYKMGILYGQLGDLTRAEAAFRRMTEVTSDVDLQAMAHLNLGVIYEKQGALESAIEHYQAGLNLDPSGKNAIKVRQIIDELTARLNKEEKR